MIWFYLPPAYQEYDFRTRWEDNQSVAKITTKRYQQRDYLYVN